MDVFVIIHNYFISIPYAIVGGGAVQICVSFIAMENTCPTSIKDMNGISFMLRRTGDIDLSFHHALAELTRIFNLNIEHSSGIPNILSFLKRFVIQRGNHRFDLNYQTESGDLKGISPYYDEIIRIAIAIRFPHNDNFPHCKSEIRIWRSKSLNCLLLISEQTCPLHNIVLRGSRSRLKPAVSEFCSLPDDLSFGFDNI